MSSQAMACGEEHIFATEDHALAAIYAWLGDEGKDDFVLQRRQSGKIWIWFNGQSKTG